jgi:uncharacterized protein YraI
MLKLRNIVAASAVVAAGALAPAIAQAAVPGFATGNVNLRAGPSTDYPVVTTLRAGDRLTIFGCVRGYSWCDVNWRGNRGWVSATYLEATYAQRRVRLPAYAARIEVPIISFTVGDYFDRNYRDRPWYRDWRQARRDGPRFDLDRDEGDYRPRPDFDRDGRDFDRDRRGPRDEARGRGPGRDDGDRRDRAERRDEIQDQRDELRDRREALREQRDELREDRDELRDNRADARRERERDRRRDDRDERFVR